MLDTFDIETLPMTQAIMVFLADPMVLLCIAIDLLLIIHLFHNPPKWREITERLNSRLWSVREAEAIIIAVVAFILVGKSIISALSDLGNIPEEHVDAWLVVAQTFLFHLPVILIIAVILWKNRKLPSGSHMYQPYEIWSSFRQGTLCCLAALPLVGLASLIQNHFLIAAGYSNEPQYVVELLNTQGPLWLKLYLVFVTVVTAPVAEEFIFRGIGITALAGKIGLKWSVLLVSLAFAMIHFNLYSFVPLFTIAVAFSLVYIYTGSLLTSIFMHSVFNGLNILAILLSSQNM